MAKVKSKSQGVDGAFYLVNPKGTIHVVSYDHARERLKTAGYRLAVDPEIAVYLESRVQRHDRPICEPWSPEPEVVEDLPEGEASTIEATESAQALAKENDIDLADVTGTGAGGRIIQKDVEALIKDE